ncbi:nucleotide-diphosphate-sugar epimerase [Rhizocola hellebori]|uniref:Nucleotide-diphosphate-sugar epimerase n=1 Tax=Rhizocola hellebori TaxID=1392758 RepID=A0A8J3Q9L3_9ACTN|nr:nucleotide-diphosphate-sugar epimerase [Rhizocola hellebori]
MAGNLSDPDSLIPALEGVTALHLINFDGTEGYTPLTTGAEIISLAAKAGVKRVTVLRGGDKGTVENALEASDLEWTFIQPVEFMSGVFDWIESIRDEGIVRAPFASVRSAMVHDSDIGAVIAAVLTQDGHAGKTYTLTGPQAMTIPQKVAAISDALGRDIKYFELSEQEARDDWRQQGLPDEVIEFFVMAHGNPPAQAYTVLPTIEQITGRPPLTLQDFVRDHAARYSSSSHVRAGS